MVVGSIALWIAIPIGWLWLGSQLQSSSNPTLGPILLVLAGIPISMVIVAKGLSRLNRKYAQVTGTGTDVRFRAPWMRSMRGERDSRPRSVLDVVMVISVSAALAAFAAWFFSPARRSSRRRARRLGWPHGHRRSHDPRPRAPGSQRERLRRRIQRHLERQDKVRFEMHAMGTSLEGRT